MRRLILATAATISLALASTAIASGPDEYEDRHRASFNPIADVIDKVTDHVKVVNNDFTRPLINGLTSETTAVHRKLHNELLHPDPSNPISETVDSAVHLVDAVTEPFLTGAADLLLSGHRAIND
jgi:hypothetical protein